MKKTNLLKMLFLFSYRGVQNKNTASLKFSRDFLKGMNDIIMSKETIVEAIYDKDNKEWVFDADEPVVTNKR